MSENTTFERELETRDDKERRLMLERIELLHELRGMNAFEVVGYVYRINKLKKERNALPLVYEFLSDEEIGLMYGPGNYSVTYHITLASNKKETRTVGYSIGREFLQLHKQYCKENGVQFFGEEIQQNSNSFTDFLSKDKLESVVGILGALKMIFGQNQAPQQDQFQTYKMLMEPQIQMLERFISNRPQSLPDQLITEAFKSLKDKKEPERNNLKEQLELFREFKELTEGATERAARENVEENENMSTMEKMISKAIDFLPVFLEQHNGNIQNAAKAAQKQKPYEIMVLKSSQKLQQTFFNELVKNQGLETAKQWANSFGLNGDLLARSVTIVPQQKPIVTPAPAPQKPIKKAVIEL